MRPKLFVALTILSTSLFCFSQAGTTNVGPDTTVQDFATDAINLMKLGISIKAAIRDKGGPIPFHDAFTVANSCTVQVYDIPPHDVGHRWSCGTSAYPTGPNNFLGAALEATTKNVLCPGSQTHATEKFEYFILYNLDSGTTWKFPPTVIQDSEGCLVPKGVTTQSIDGSGVTLVISSTWTGEPSGFAYTANGVYAAVFGGGQNGTSLTDSNGNSLSSSASNRVVTYTDAFATNPETYDQDANAATWQTPLGQEPVTVSTAAFTYQTDFDTNCAHNTSPATVTWPTSINYPDGTTLGIGYEQASGYYTGRLGSLTLRTGGTITYSYGDMSCNGSYTPILYSLSRTDANGTTTYSTQITNSCCNPSNITTTVLDPGNNKTVYYFTGVILGGTVYPPPYPTYGSVLTEVQRFPNTGTPSGPSYATTPAVDNLYCYNNVLTGCQTALVAYPITQKDIYHTISGVSTARMSIKLDAYGNQTSVARYDFGGSSPSFTDVTAFGSWNGSTCTAIGSHVNDKPCQIINYDASNNIIGDRFFTYDTHGNLLTSSKYTGARWLSTSYQYNSNGTVKQQTDPNGTITYYNYGDCNGLLPTHIQVSPASGDTLTTLESWDCNGAVPSTSTDASGNVTQFTYNDPFYRVTGVLYGAAETTSTSYGPNTVSTTDSSSSGPTVEHNIDRDGLGRTIDSQTQSSSSNYDTVSSIYTWSGVFRETETSAPCSKGLNQQCTSAYGYVLRDMLDRPVSKVLPNGVTTTSYSYPDNDILSTLSPAPSGENVKSTQAEYDAFGRTKSSCAISSATGSTSCGQNNSKNGVVTNYAYTSSPTFLTTTATLGLETRTDAVDLLGRTISDISPESGTQTTTYDVATSHCSSATMGDMVEVDYANGDYLCYKYDGIHRVTDVTPNSPSATNVCRRFRYDNSAGVTGAIPTGISLSNYEGQMVEAETDNCSTPFTPITDEWFSYDVAGRLTDVYEMTPHSSGYYHTTVAFYPSGLVHTFSGIPGWANGLTYSYDYEGRWLSVAQGSSTLVSAVAYNAAGQVTEVDIGNAGDKDAYAYDPTSNNTGLMATYTFSVKSITDVGTLSWNGNGTLNQLSISDGFNSGGTQTCTFSYDDLVRLLTDNCGSVWSQTFVYDQFDNITKSGSISWAPGYNTKNQYTTIGATYDASGNLGYDSFNSYTWDSYGKMNAVTPGKAAITCGSTGTCVTYDALGRTVEKNNAGTSIEEVLYGPSGQTALMNGQTVVDAWIPSPGGSKVLVIGANQFYQHLDWLGSARAASSIAGQTVYYDKAFAPYGEIYDTFGNTNVDLVDFTGDRQAIVPGLYDTPNREQAPNQGRWISPDPAGSGWNLYAYSANPNSETDPTGLANGQHLQKTGCIDGFDIVTCGGSTNQPSDGVTVTVNGQDSTQAVPPTPDANNQPANSAQNAAPPSGNGSTSIVTVSATSSAPGTLLGGLIGELIEPVGGGIPGAILGSFVGTGVNVSNVPSTDSWYAGPTVSFTPALFGGNGVSASDVIVPSGQSANSIANGTSYSVTFQPTPLTGSTVTKSPGSGPAVAGPSVGTKVPLSFSASHNFDITQTVHSLTNMMNSAIKTVQNWF
jgi:RHS repeat-associated protein